jgi:hypothetical protein
VLAAELAPPPPPKNRLEHRESAGFRAPVGSALTIGSKSSASDKRSVPYGLRAWHRRHVFDIHPSLAGCGLNPLPVSVGGSGRASLVCSDTKAVIRNVATCKSPWSCPVCAPRVAAARAESLGPQIKSLVSNGGTVWLVTLTLSHKRETPLLESLDGIRKAWSIVTSGRAWKEKRENGKIEYARGFDVTWSNSNGWHPHLHLSLFLGSSHKNPEAVARWIVERWKGALEARGYYASMAAQDFQKCDDAEKAAAYAVTPASCYETLSMATKRSRGEGSGLTPFEILSFAASQKIESPHRISEKQALLLWKEYVAATKGRRQASTSQGLHLVQDEEILEDGAGSEFKEIALLEKDILKQLDRENKTVPLFQEVERARPAGIDAARDAARRFLSGCASRGWWIVDPPDPSPPPARPPDG